MSILPVQHNLGADGSGTNGLTVALTGSVVGSGNLVVGAVQWAPESGLVTIVSILDDKGNVYNIADTVEETTDDQTQATFWLNNITNGPKTITVTFSGGVGGVGPTFRRILWDEFSGITTSAPTDGHTAQQNAGSTATNAQTSGSITTATNGDLIWSAFSDCQGAGATWSAGTGFTILNNGTSGDNDNMGSEWQVQTTAGSIAGTFTQNVSSSSVVGIIAFKAAGGGAAVATLGVTSGTIFVPGGRARGPARGLSATRAFADPIIPIVPAIQIGRPQGFLFRPGSGVTWDIKTRSAFPSGAGTVFNDSVSETGIAVDTPSASAVFAASDTEAGTATDAPSGVWVTSSTITEAGTAADSETVTASFASSITEANSAADSYVNTAVFVASDTEAGSASDSPSSTAIFAASDTEAASAADSESSTGAVISDGVIEAAAAAETETAIVTFAAAASEAGSATDASSNTAIFSAAASEAGSAIDAEDANGVFVASDTEAATATDLSNGIIPGPPSTDGPHSNPFFATPGPMTTVQ